jgi:hypothetical protein
MRQPISRGIFDVLRKDNSISKAKEIRPIGIVHRGGRTSIIVFSNFYLIESFSLNDYCFN